jgi:hypothetical protein
MRKELRRHDGFEISVGGVYVTAETKTSFKGYYPVSSNAHSILMRSFIQFDGEGDTAKSENADVRFCSSDSSAAACAIAR